MYPLYVSSVAFENCDVSVYKTFKIAFNKMITFGTLNTPALADVESQS